MWEIYNTFPKLHIWLRLMKSSGFKEVLAKPDTRLPFHLSYYTSLRCIVLMRSENAIYFFCQPSKIDSMTCKGKSGVADVPCKETRYLSPAGIHNYSTFSRNWYLSQVSSSRVQKEVIVITSCNGLLATTVNSETAYFSIASFGPSKSA